MNFHLGIPQAIYVVITILGLTIAAVRHGKPRSPENVWTMLIGTAISMGLLIWGGFFK